MRPLVDLDPRFQHLGLKVGSFFILFLVLLLIMLGMFIWRQDLLVSSIEFYVRPDRADAIHPGMDVTLHGIRVGRVTRLDLGSDGLPEMTLRVRKDSAKWIRSDAVVRLSGLDFFNTPFLAILPGSKDCPPAQDGTQLPFDRELTIGEIASKLEAQISPLIADVGKFLNELKHPEGPILSSLRSVRSIANALEKDVPGLLEESRAAAAAARSLLEEMNSESGDLRVSAAKARAMADEISERLPILLDHTQRTLASAEASAKILEKTLAASSQDVQLTVKKSVVLVDKADSLVDDVRKIWLLKMLLPRAPRVSRAGVISNESRSPAQ
jgi:ABC-type transporter Mla subunit MlaD